MLSVYRTTQSSWFYKVGAVSSPLLRMLREHEWLGQGHSASHWRDWAWSSSLSESAGVWSLLCQRGQKPQQFFLLLLSLIVGGGGWGMPLEGGITWKQSHGSATHLLCDGEQVTSPLCAQVLSSLKWDEMILYTQNLVRPRAGAQLRAAFLPKMIPRAWKELCRV